MSQLHKFLFDNLPVRGMLVHLTDAWQTVLERRKKNSPDWPATVHHLMGEMAAAGVLMQANIHFDGALILQLAGSGPLKLAVVEVQPDLAFRVTAQVNHAALAPFADFQTLVNTDNQGRCALTLDPKHRHQNQAPYQGVVALQTEQGPVPHLAAALEHYMHQSEQLETTIILAANDRTAAGLLIQQLPREGAGNLEGQGSDSSDDAYNRIKQLAATLKPTELLNENSTALLQKLFWQEDVRLFEPLLPRFACNCSRDRVAQMLKNLGQLEVTAIIKETQGVQIKCEFCGLDYQFSASEAGGLFF
jgi:molecular chaperone Hsp33